jgi:hypothetical protein
MSESTTPALPGPGGGQGTAAPGSTRVFQPTRVGSTRMPGISERGAIEEIHRRRMGETPRGVQRDDGTGGRLPAPRDPRASPRRQADPGATAPPRSREEFTAPGDGMRPAEGDGYSPLSALLADATESRIGTDWPAAPAPGQAARPAPVGDPTFTLTIGGQPRDVPLSELARGYIGATELHTLRTQADQHLRQAQDAQAQFTRAREALEQRLPLLIAELAEPDGGKPIDLLKLAREDPIGYAQVAARREMRREAEAELARLHEVRAREETTRKQQIKAMGHQFLARVLPGWADAGTRQQLQTAQATHLRECGYSQEEIDAAEMLDPRQIIILEESRRFRALVRAYPDLLRQDAPRPRPPQARDTPRAMPGNGRLAERAQAQPSGRLAEAERSWADLGAREGAVARETAVSLIGARRAARNLTNRGAV